MVMVSAARCSAACRLAGRLSAAPPRARRAADSRPCVHARCCPTANLHHARNRTSRLVLCAARSRPRAAHAHVRHTHNAHRAAAAPDDLFQAAANLHGRLTHEMDQAAELVALVDAAKAAGALTFNLTDGQRRTMERLQCMSNALATSLLRLDDMIALLTEYAAT